MIRSFPNLKTACGKYLLLFLIAADFGTFCRVFVNIVFPFILAQVGQNSVTPEEPILP